MGFVFVFVHSKDPGHIKAYLWRVQKERWAPFSSDPILLPLRLKDYILLLLSPAFFSSPWGVPSLWSLKSSRAKMTSGARSVQPDTCLMAMVAQCQLSVTCPCLLQHRYGHTHTPTHSSTPTQPPISACHTEKENLFKLSPLMRCIKIFPLTCASGMQIRPKRLLR